MKKAIYVILATSISGLFYQAARADVINGVIAHVGNKVITAYDVQSLDPKRYKEIVSIDDAETRKARLDEYNEQVLTYLINQEIVAVAAEREGIKVSEKEVDEAVSDILTRNNLDEEQLSQYLEREGMSLIQYRFKLKNDILNARVRSQVLMTKIVVVEEDLREYADAHPEEYPIHDKYEIKLLIAGKKETLNEALAFLREGVSFEEAAKKYSADRSAINGGYLGWMESDIMDPAMLRAVENTKTGSVSKPFQINGQWALATVSDVKSRYDFDEETRKKLSEAASERIFEQVFEGWLEKNKNTIVVIREEDSGALR